MVMPADSRAYSGSSFIMRFGGLFHNRRSAQPN
jgi:hypothetical protein